MPGEESKGREWRRERRGKGEGVRVGKMGKGTHRARDPFKAKKGETGERGREYREDGNSRIGEAEIEGKKESKGKPQNREGTGCWVERET